VNGSAARGDFTRRKNGGKQSSPTKFPCRGDELRKGNHWIRRGQTERLKTKGGTGIEEVEGAKKGPANATIKGRGQLSKSQKKKKKRKPVEKGDTRS